jgi:hypothetical protein
MTKTISASDEVQELLDGFSTLQLEIAGVQESLRQNQAEMVQTQEDLCKRQED